MKNRRVFWRAVPVLALLVLILLLLGQPRPLAEDQLLLRLAENQRRGRPMQALYQVEALAARDGWTPELLRLAGEIWHDAGDLPRAAAYWSAIPDDSGVLRRLADIYIELQDWTAAAQTLERLLAVTPDDRRARYLLGLIQAAGSPDAARENLLLAAADPLYRETAAALLEVIETTTAHLPMQIGIALAELGLWPQAELAFERAAAADGPLAEALAYKALARDRQGKDGRADMARARELAPRNALVSYLDGLHQRAAGDLAGSLAAFQLAAALDPTNPAYAAELGAAYHLADDLGQAEEWLKHAVALSGQDPRFQRLLDAFYAETLPN